MNKISPLKSSSRLTVTYRPLGDLIPDPRNARTIPSAKSIRYAHQIVRKRFRLLNL
jgi:hypothetical protein